MSSFHVTLRQQDGPCGFAGPAPSWSKHSPAPAASASPGSLSTLASAWPCCADAGAILVVYARRWPQELREPGDTSRASATLRAIAAVWGGRQSLANPISR